MANLNAQQHKHHHRLSSMSLRRLWWALMINAVFLVVEVIGGILTHSLALLADGGHMFTDVGALALAIFVARLARRTATPERTFGLLRAEVLGAFINGATLVLIVGLIFWEAIRRLSHPDVIEGPLMLAVAMLGLMANLASVAVLAGHRQKNVNIQGAFFHMLADALGSVGAIVAAVVIWTTGWYTVDSIASLLIGILILWSSWGFLRRTINILLEATPEDIDYGEVKRALESLEHIDEVHDLHIWTITSGMPVITAHITLKPGCCDTSHWQSCLNQAQDLLKERFGVSHSTLQVEPIHESCQEECRFFEDPSK